ncbi:MAG TPA: type II secretion system protein [Candidatus Paceibacterota bacterium]|nr:type II secretion system protein [Candidatus Paceibacterota bacterium]
MKSVLSLGHVRRGFTLIELLVVIAIIGILSSVVLASLNTARSKGTDAKIQSEIRSIGVNAEIYYDNNGNSYGSATTTTCTTGMFASTNNPNIAQIVTDLNAAVGTAADATCIAGPSGWAVQHQLQSQTGKFCMDSTGKVSTSTTAISATQLCS